MFEVKMESGHAWLSTVDLLKVACTGICPYVRPESKLAWPLLLPC